MSVFKTQSLGELRLNNKIVMAPLTRSRAINNIPNDLMATYYRQRASAGLIISEGTSPSPNGIGYPRILERILTLKLQDGRILRKQCILKGKLFVQLMHTGRITAKLNMPEGSVTLAPSAIQAVGEMFTEQGLVAHEVPKAMTLQDIAFTQNEYVLAAKRLVQEAGVDGIELHAANGYLMNQFINPGSNQRDDEYGGSIENRSRFVLETAQMVADTIGKHKVGIRISPYGAFNDMQSHYESLEETFVYLAKELHKIDLAYIHIVDQRVAFGAPDFRVNIKKVIKDNFKGIVISGGDVNTREKAEAILESGMDLVYVGRPFISNPDFVEKLQHNLELVPADANTFYTPGEKGYTDY